MDDCNLQKLSIQPGKLSPDFNKATTQYQVTVPSNVENVTFECVTSDSGASYSISKSGGTKVVPLEEGKVNEIKIEVTAEDGTAKQYFVNVKRLSAKDASLTGLETSLGKLVPTFDPTTDAYSINLPCQTSSIQLKPTVADVRCELTVNSQPPGLDILLNVGETRVVIGVFSADKSNQKAYTVSILRQQVPRYFKLKDKREAMMFEDPISLSPFYRPVSINGTEPKHVFSQPIIAEITKISKVNPISKAPLQGDWALVDTESDHRLSQCQALIPLTFGGFLECATASDVGSKVTGANQTPKSLDGAEAKYTSVSVAHAVEIRNWEKKLHKIFDEANPVKLLSMAQSHLGSYRDMLSKATPSLKSADTEGEGPLDLLDKAACCMACAIKGKKSDPNLHLQLGMVLEERYYAEDMHGLQSQEATDFSATNTAAKESSKEEECQAICRLRGVSAGAQLSLQLKAIDEEYHHLIDTGQTAKADNVMALFAWKSKQANQEGAAAQKAADEMTPLGQAYLKYMDALSLDESKAVYHFHVGRLLVIQGNYEQAVTRLQSALSWNVQHTLARFYLGMALALQTDGPKERLREAITYLAEGMELLLTEKTNQALNIDAAKSGEDKTKVELYAERLLRDNNVHLLRGINELGKLLTKMATPAAGSGSNGSSPDRSTFLSAEDAFHTAAHIASYALPGLARGDVYKQLEWVVLEAHSNLLDSMLNVRPRVNTSDTVTDAWIARRCERLSALISSCTIPSNPRLLVLQEKACQTLVRLQPCSSRALCLLGEAQLARFDDDPSAADSKNQISEAVQSFLASIDLEGKPDHGEVPATIKDQSWWQHMMAQEATLRSSVATNPAAAAAGGKPASIATPSKGTLPPQPGSKASPGGGASSSKQAPGGRGAAAPAAGSTAAKSPAAAAAAKPAPAAAAKGAAAASAKTPAAAKPAATGATPTAAATAAAKPASKGALAKPAATTTGQAATVKEPGPVAVASVAGSDSTQSSTGGRDSQAASGGNMTATAAGAPAQHRINEKHYRARLGLARVLSRAPETAAECHKYYAQVMSMAPEVHDAYIESAELLAKTDPFAAVDIYAKFPVPENPGFDDAYIFGEVVRLLFKAEKYDDPRLAPNMITLGKVMGLGYLEKNVKVLEEKFKNDLLKKVYAGVNGKTVDDPAMIQFFKFKCWM